MAHTGLDVSLRVCRTEGYAVVKHESKKLKPDKKYRITISNPKGWNESGTVNSHYKGAYYLVNTMYSYRELYDYWQTVDGINEYCGVNRCPFLKPESASTVSVPTFHDLLHMAQTLHNYCGLP